MDTIGKRLEYFLENNKINRQEFLKKTGFSATSLTRVINEGTGLNSTNIARIIENYPELNITWLITGNGTYKNDNAEKYEVEEERETYFTKGDAELKTKVRTILNNEVVLDVLVEILKKYEK